jgi:hypothetical protein
MVAIRRFLVILRLKLCSSFKNFSPAGLLISKNSMTTLLFSNQFDNEKYKKARYAVIITHSYMLLYKMRDRLKDNGFLSHGHLKQATNGAFYCAFIIPDTPVCIQLTKHNYQLAKTRAKGDKMGHRKKLIAWRLSDERKKARKVHRPKERNKRSDRLSREEWRKKAASSIYSERLKQYERAFTERYVTGREWHMLSLMLEKNRLAPLEQGRLKLIDNI